VPQLAPQFLARRFKLTSLPANAARPGVLAQRIDHGAPNPSLRERFKLDPTRLVKAVSRVDQTDDPILHQVADID